MTCIMDPAKKLLIVDNNVAPLTLVVIRCLGLLPGFEIHVISLGNQKCPQFRFSKYLKTCITKSFADDEEAYAHIKQRAREIGADLIIPVNEKAVQILSSNASDCLKYFSLPPIPEPDTLYLVRNKWELYRWLYENQYSNCKPLLVKELLEDKNKEKELHFPLLVKPIWGSGGTGIRFVKTFPDLGKVISDITEPADFVIQPIIPGYDIDISLLARNGEILAYTIQKSIERSKTKYIYAKAIHFLQNEDLLKITSAIIRHIGFSGIAHLDFRYDTDENSYKLIDFNARYWSSLLGSLNAGINFPYLAISSNGTKELHAYNYSNYYIDSNILNILWKRRPLKNTEFMYNIKDPAPFIADIMVKINFHVRKRLGLNRR